MIGEISINLSKFKVAERLAAFKGISKGIIYLCDASNLNGLDKLKKRALFEEESLLTYQINNEKFQIKLKKSTLWSSEVTYSLYIKHPDLPGPDDLWYKVKNWEAINIILLVGEKFDENNELLLEPDKFEFIFNDTTNNCIIFNKEKPEFKSILLKNTFDSGVYETSTKTSKRVPGNLYISKRGNRNYYLSDLWKIIDESGEKIKYQVYVSEITEKDEDVGQILIQKLLSEKLSINEGPLGEKTYGINSKKNWVNVGSKLKPMSDDFDIRDFWEEAVEEYVKRNKKPYSKYSNFYKYEYVSSFIKIFSLTNNDTSIEEDSLKITPRIREIGREIVECIIFENLYNNYWIENDELPESCRRRYTIKQYKDLDKIKIKEFSFNEMYSRCYSFSFNGVSKRDDFIRLFLEKLLGLNLDAIFEYTWIKFMNLIPDMTTSLQNLINWKDRIETWYSPRINNTLRQTKEFTINKWQGPQKEQQDPIENWPKPDTPNLRSLLIDMYSKSLENSGVGVTSLEISSYNLGKKDQTHLLTCTITIEDIVNYYGGDIKSIPDDITNELIKNRLVVFGIETTNNDFKINTKL